MSSFIIIAAWPFVAALLQCAFASFVLLQCSGKKGGGAKDATKSTKDGGKKTAGKDAPPAKDGAGKKTTSKAAPPSKDGKKATAPGKEAPPTKAAPGKAADPKATGPGKAPDAAAKKAPAAAAEVPAKSTTKQIDPTQRTDIPGAPAGGPKSKKGEVSLQKTQAVSVKDDPKSTKSDKPSMIVSKLANPKGDPAEVKVDPDKLNYKAGDEKAKLKIENLTDRPLALKLKCSDNEVYKFKPVFFVLKPKEQHEHEINRKSDAKPKVDKLLVVYADAKDAEANAKKVYESKPAAKEIAIGLVAA